MKIFLTCILTLVCTFVRSQDSIDTTRWQLLFEKNGKKVYIPKLSKAEQLERQGRLMDAIKAYSLEYEQNPSETKKLLSIAELYSRQNKATESFFAIRKYLQDDSDSTLRVLSMGVFFPLVTDPRWADIEQDLFKKFLARQKRTFSKQNLILPLLRMGISAGAYNDLYAFYKVQGTPESEAIADSVMKERLAVIAKPLADFKELIQQEGWFASSQVGEDASNAAFWVLYNCDREVQRSLFPMLEKAVIKGDFDPAKYAAMVDVGLYEEHKPQLYGSIVIPQVTKQEFVSYPIEKLEEVDSRRKNIGLPPLKDYLSGWSVTNDDPKKESLKNILAKSSNHKKGHKSAK
jgi:hypothetical protein